MTTTARINHEQQVGFISMTIPTTAAGVAGFAAGLEMPARLPAGCTVDKTTVLTTTLYNGTTPTASVGYTATGTELINATSIAAQARVDTVAPIANAGPRAADTQIFVSGNAGAAASTAGSITVIVYYCATVG